MQSSIYSRSVIKRGGYYETTTPRSVYSPTTPGVRQNSASPAYLQGNMYSSTPLGQESGAASSQYSPLSPSYNPLSPRYGGLQSSYSRNSPYYNPSLGASGTNLNFGNNNRNNNQNNQNNNNNNNANSPIQSDEEGENEN